MQHRLRRDDGLLVWMVLGELTTDDTVELVLTLVPVACGMYLVDGSVQSRGQLLSWQHRREVPDGEVRMQPFCLV